MATVKAAAVQAVSAGDGRAETIWAEPGALNGRGPRDRTIGVPWEPQESIDASFGAPRRVSGADSQEAVTSERTTSSSAVSPPGAIDRPIGPTVTRPSSSAVTTSSSPARSPSSPTGSQAGQPVLVAVTPARIDVLRRRWARTPSPCGSGT